MSIDITTLFTRIGKFVKYINTYLTLQGTTLLGSGSGADDILDQYAARRDLVTTVQRDYDGFANNVAGWNSRLKGYSDTTLADLQTDLATSSAAMAVIVPALSAYLLANSQTVKANTVGSLTVTANGSNTGNGKLVAGKTNSLGADDERILNEIVTATVTTSVGAGGSSGGESISLVGYPKQSVNSYLPQGNGSSRLLVSDLSNLLTGGGFESFSAGVPDGWAINNGAAGYNIRQELTNVHRGAGALCLRGDGAIATINISQSLTSLTAGVTYCASVWLRKAGTVSTTSTLAVRVTGTGLSTKNLYSADPNGLTTSYAHSYVFFTVPAAPPSDYRIEFNWSTANAAGATALIYADDAVVIRPVRFGFVQYAAFAGATNFAVGDSFTLPTTNDNGGLFQSYFNRFYGVQLPSSGSPTIDDALAS